MQPKIYFAEEHGIDSLLIDPDALYVMNKLRQAGYTAYMVGGSVRDLLTKRLPKDYDISTSAKPEEIKQLFQRNCILIGRRFRLAHIRFGHKILELSTFRAGDNTDADLILQDNQWGTPEEDVRRRDFTINGLFYDSSNNSIIDYVGGWEDIKKRTLRTIGDPWVRFKQDPVRMIRLLKFRARFNFEIDPKSRKALVDCKEEIIKSSTARILEEFFRMLESGSAMSFFLLMSESGLLERLFPALDNHLKGTLGQSIYRYLAGADRIHSKGRLKNPLDRSILVSCLLYPILEKEIKEKFHDLNITPQINDIMVLTGGVIKEIVTNAFTHFPKRISSSVSYILTTQSRLTPQSGKKHHRPKIIRNKEFSSALNFLKIRALVDEKLIQEYASWRDLFRQSERHNDKKHHSPSPHHKRDQKNASAS